MLSRTPQNTPKEVLQGVVFQFNANVLLGEIGGFAHLLRYQRLECQRGAPSEREVASQNIRQEDK